MPKLQSRYVTRLRKQRTILSKTGTRNVRNNNKERENKTLHAKVYGGSDRGSRGDDPRLGESAGQKVHQRVLNGTA